MNVSIHQVKSIKIEEIQENETSYGERFYVRDIIVTTAENQRIEIRLFSDNNQSIEVKL